MEDAMSIEILDEMDEPLTEVEIECDEISDDICVGDVIELREAC